MADLLLGPLVGGLSDSRAFLWGRASGPGILTAWLGRQADLSDAYRAGQSLPLDAGNGFAGVAPVSNLQADTEYFYALTLEDQPPDVSAGPYPGFTTFPTPGSRADFSFLLGSCFLPADENGGAIFEAVNHRRVTERLRFGLLVGDQIYADNWLRNPIGRVARTVDDYRAVYAYTWSRPPLRHLLRNLPVFMTLDDHEVDDDWTWQDAGRTRAQIPIWDRVWRWLNRRPGLERRLDRHQVQAALKAYWEHQGMHAPPLLDSLHRNAQDFYLLEIQDSGSLAYTFTYGAAAFFVMDTRSMRVKSRNQTCILGDGQFEALRQWLLEVKDLYPLKFIVSSGAVLFNMWLDLARDRWSGFPKDRKQLLSLLAAEGIEGVYILTGDLHSAHAVRAELYGPNQQAVPLWEFCSSPFEQDPNWLAPYVYMPVRGAPLRNQSAKFVVAEPNFGIVRVSFAGGEPEVQFEIYNRTGEKITSVSSRSEE